MLTDLNMIGGLRVFVVPTWARGYRWEFLRRERVPVKAKRKGTRRQWKRAHPSGLRWRYGPVEPDGMLKTDQGLYCTARQKAALDKAIAAQRLAA